MKRLAPLTLLAALVLASSAQAATVNVSILGVGDPAYDPDPATAHVGDQVTWTNNDAPTQHTATADGGAFDTGVVPGGTTSSSVTFDAAGSFTYHCKIHPSMHGTLNVAGISGRVFADSDASNSITAADDGLGGATVTEYDALAYQADPQGAVPLDAVVTGSDGRYVLDNNPAPAGGYATLVVSDKPGYTTPAPIVGFAAGPNSVAGDKNFLYKGEGTVSGTVWNDPNGNGVHEAPESPREGASVSLNGKRQVTTGASGTYSFPSALPGAGTVTVTPPTGFQAVGGASRPVDLNVGNTFEQTGVDFFVREAPASVGGVVRDDPNGNAVADPGEGTVPGVVLGLDTNGDGTADTTTTSAADGTYRFSNLEARPLPPLYRVILNVPDGYEGTGPGAIEKGVAAGQDASLSSFFIRKIQPAASGPPPAGDQPPENVEIPVRNAGKATNGNDRLIGTGKADRLLGLGGNDFLQGLGGNDVLDGGAGDDTLIGGPGKDKLTGGKGNDKLTGNGGKDSFAGGPGNDRINSKDRVKETVNCGTGKDTVKADRNDKLIGCEKRT